MFKLEPVAWTFEGDSLTQPLINAPRLSLVDFFSHVGDDFGSGDLLLIIQSICTLLVS